MAESPQTDDIYERLANALDALPHGFARTASGVEVRLIKKAFTEQEVWLAGNLTRLPGPATATLESLVPRRLVRLDSPGMSAPGVAPPVAGEKLAGVAEGAQKSNYRAVIDPEPCTACGVCVIGCPTDAIRMEPVPEEEWFHVPSSMAEWEEMRLRNMGAEA
jgi:NAD-dependent dihydropyrimidine dehydrogenase PreA subunit